MASKMIETPLIEWANKYGVSEHELLTFTDKLPPDAIVAGGAVRDFLERIPIRSDVDIFRIQKRGELSTPMLEWAMFLGKETIAAKHFIGFTVGERKCQVITLSDYYSVDDVLDSFDFTICQVAASRTTLYFTADSLYAIGQKRLAVHKITHGVASLRRLLKYNSYGFRPCDGTLRDIINMPDAARESEITYVD